MVSGVGEVHVEAGGKRRAGAPSGEPEASREVRWSARRKEQVLLRLLRGESLDLLVREMGQPAGRIAQQWLIERHGYLTPTEARDHLRAQAVTAA